jgi:hypothetical protein
MSGHINDDLIQVTSDKYFINVIETEPQVIDTKQCFFVKDRSPSRATPKSKSVKELNTVSFFKPKNSETQLDVKITEKIKTQLNFESILKELDLDKYIKNDLEEEENQMNTMSTKNSKNINS